ncbi:hypothetical protein E6W39_00920 [Kitasatospora acidiphila]|uniref:Uncharacterized protein n=1 Tax=Kitasatospora acidiphila TaxID=2567942 RepID=A0A540WG37_9ACTN|nr:hypothetical protein [Kitasatospora acidiphila]TQF07932.1 hypothetical protein E6W39_00920 [Kitasatospora acidiphila]
MAVGRAARQAARRPRVEAVFGKDATPAALDLLELVEYAWHDAYHEITPSEALIDDILTCSQGDLGRLIRFGLLAVVDARDLWMAVEAIRAAESDSGTGERTG